MKAAFAVHNGRLAPVFDTARKLCVVEAEGGRIISEKMYGLSEESPFRRAEQLAALHIDLLVCGAISRMLQNLIEAYGVKLKPFIAGELSEVIQAWLAGTLDHEHFMMPGCCGRRRRGRRDGTGRRRRRQGKIF
ncbi:MAG: hypothetical protein GX589_00010 [Deltaproteobacteria bacterium]|nr:hypothetical protein [Deltaproteobacteria bacterium]